MPISKSQYNDECWVCGNRKYKTEVVEAAAMFARVFGEDTRIEKFTCLRCGAISLFDYGISKWSKVPNDKFNPPVSNRESKE